MTEGGLSVNLLLNEDLYSTKDELHMQDHYNDELNLPLLRLTYTRQEHN